MCTMIFQLTRGSRQLAGELKKTVHDEKVFYMEEVKIAAAIAHRAAFIQCFLVQGQYYNM